MAVRHGADALGLIAAMPSGPGPIPEREIARIAPTVPPFVTPVLLTSLVDADEIIEQQVKTRVRAIQLVDEVDPVVHEELRKALPGVALIQVIHVEGRESVKLAREVAGRVDAVLLDSGTPKARVKVLGGTGRVHDWSLSRKIVQALEIPVILAGGLNPENVTEAVRKVRPWGVDICTGIRDRQDYSLQEQRLDAFLAAVHTADREE